MGLRVHILWVIRVLSRRLFPRPAAGGGRVALRVARVRGNGRGGGAALAVSRGKAAQVPGKGVAAVVLGTGRELLRLALGVLDSGRWKMG